MEGLGIGVKTKLCQLISVLLTRCLLDYKTACVNRLDPKPYPLDPSSFVPLPPIGSHGVIDQPALLGICTVFVKQHQFVGFAVSSQPRFGQVVSCLWPN